MKTERVSSHLLLVLMLLILSSCQQKNPSNDLALASLDLLRGDITLCGTDQFGEVSFAVSCTDAARETFDLAISLLHSFEYDEAEKAFVKVIDIDPQCAMAYWGVAMSNFHALWVQSGTGYLEKGSKILELAELLRKSDREKAYLDAISVFYQDWQTLDHQTRVRRFEKRMEYLYNQYPDDEEAAVFYSLALRASADPSDKNYTNQKRSGKILESIFADQPNHPGIAHYIIHNYDYPELAELALPTARRYAQIAPSSSHAQHMPSHIFTRLGLWEESIESNINSTASALCYAESLDVEGHWDEELHGMDYLVYAYLQIGDNLRAKQQLDYLKTFKKVFPVNFKTAYTAAALPSRIALENRNWHEAVNLQLPAIEMDWNDFPWQRSIMHFARALGSARSGDIANADKEWKILQDNHQILVKRDKYMANQVLIQVRTVQAWIEFAKGNHEQALELMREASEMEYNTEKHAVTPGEVLPAGELLGDMLMAAKQPADALKAYENDLKKHPNRFNGLYGAAVAARASGDIQKAKSYFNQLLEQTERSNSDRVEIEEAREFLKARKNI